MDPRGGPARGARIDLVGTSVDAVPGLRAAGEELTLDIVEGGIRRRGELSLFRCDGQDGLRSLAGRNIDVPSLPIEPTQNVRAPTTEPAVEWAEAGVSPLSVPRDRAVGTVRLFLLDGGDMRRFPTLTLETEEETRRALFDAALVTDEPGTIARFTVRSDGDQITDVRADGIVAATAAGSHGFARGGRTRIGS